ncbi:hypothetical protein BT63DRAFT_426174 [Microthyrium microscopicum]|uniref:Neutral protease 2 n=1 Tax=Microthyrium microscopicum TaxID=703497 RepID=A0A6A6U4S8_9PEZI|nr:hypothetical protein BT63DRAFT_426174 [Microthyrium microscopicum]
MRITLQLLVASLALTAAAKKSKKPNENHIPFDVKIAHVEGTEVTVTVTNKWKKDVNVFKRMNILDSNPVQKVNVTRADGTPARFIGAHARLNTEKLDKASFDHLGRKKSTKITFDLSHIYDLSEGGKFEVHAEGGLPWAKKKKTDIVGTAPYKTEKLTIDVDKEALASKKTISQKTVIQSDCSGDRLERTREANAVCAMLATMAGWSAVNGDAAQFERYFRTQDPNMRQQVSRRFFAVADECLGKTSLSTTLCSDQLNLCKSDYISVTYGTQITNCDMYWRFPTLSDQCHSYDQATLTIHETTHVDGLDEPSTVDFQNNYGWPALTYLTPEQAVTNAANYQYFANAIYAGADC